MAIDVPQFQSNPNQKPILIITQSSNIALCKQVFSKTFISHSDSPNSDGEHVEDVAALDPAQEHDDADDTERVERKLLAEHPHANLQRRLTWLQAIQS